MSNLFLWKLKKNLVMNKSRWGREKGSMKKVAMKKEKKNDFTLAEIRNNAQ